MVLSFVGFLALGTLSPFVMSLGYVWVDTFYPHLLSYGLLSTVPVAFIMGAAAFGTYIAFDRRNPPRFSVLLVLYFVLAFWITLTTSWALVPSTAWAKYDVSIKTLLFSAFIPFVFRSRVQIEAYIQVIMFSAAAHILPWGVKTAISGGGYEQSLGQLSSNASSLSESSVISAVCFAFIPILLVLAQHNKILPPSRITRLGFYGMVFTYAVGSIGTFARTGLVGLVVMGTGLWWQAKRKIGFAIVAALGLATMFAFTSDRWTARISTVAEYNTESSALVRILVWKWTWSFVQENPFGGGFNAYVVNRITIPSPDPMGEPIIQTGRAFHNIYFAVLGEHGFPGLALYLTIVALSFLALQKTRRLTRDDPEHAWCNQMAGALQISLATLLACANFVDISFSPLMWDLLALALCLREYARRAYPTQTSRFKAQNVSGLTVQPGLRTWVM